MSYRSLDKNTAKSIVHDFEAQAMADSEEKCAVDQQLTVNEKNLREKFQGEFWERSKPIPAEKDLSLGLTLYTDWLSLGNDTGNIDLRMASDDGFWRNLTCRVVPDYVLRRWSAKVQSDGSYKWNIDRYYNKPQRNWLKITWWMCYLSWQGDSESTEQALKKLGNDAISQVVERTGPSGYRVNLYREIIAKATGDEYPDQASAEAALRRAMKLNTMRIQTTIPEFHEAGLQGYVAALFSKQATSSREERTVALADTGL